MTALHLASAEAYAAQLDPPELREFFLDVVSGLSLPQRRLASKYFYDVRGSELFDQICELPEYYPTRTEAEIMRDDAPEMAEVIGSDIRLVELGSGSSTKTRHLLEHLTRPSSYVPVDISGQHLMHSAERLAGDFPVLDIRPAVADFTRPFAIPGEERRRPRTCFYFPGSTIGNFVPQDAQQLLRGWVEMGGPQAGLLIGVDLVKEVQVLEAAYNDAAGVTAEFNRNVLHRIQHQLGADIDVDQFAHLAFFNEAASRIEMHLEAETRLQFTVGPQTFAFEWGETILTEYSHKYTIDGFCDLAAGAGWQRQHVWTDARGWFAVIYLQAASNATLPERPDQ